MKKILVTLALLLVAAPDTGLADARRDYKAKCANCHGANALMTVKTARKLGVDPRKLSLMASSMGRDEMIAIVEKGKGKMPGFEKDLTKEEIDGIVEYLLNSRAKRIKKESLIRIKEPSPPDHAPAETSGKNQQAAP